MNKFNLVIKASIIAKKIQKNINDGILKNNNKKSTIIALEKILNNDNK